jgi:hypothetical protein
VRHTKDEVLGQAIEGGCNIMMSTVYRDSDMACVRRLKESGYAVYLIAMCCNYEQTEERGREREVATERVFAGTRERFDMSMRGLLSIAMLEVEVDSMFFADNRGNCPREWNWNISGVSSVDSDLLFLLQKIFHICHVLGVAQLPPWTADMFIDRNRLAAMSCLSCVEGEVSNHAVIKTEDQHPQCLYIIGPQASGKTYAWRHKFDFLSQKFGMGKKKSLVVDGELYCDAHLGYQHNLSVGQMSTEFHHTIGVHMREWKEGLFRQATRERCDIVLPVTGTSQHCSEECVHDLQSLGYVVHLLIIDITAAQSAIGCEKRATTTQRPQLQQSTFDQTQIMGNRLRASIKGTFVRIDNEKYKWNEVV